MSPPQQVVLPDLRQMCSWTSSMNPYYSSAGREAAEWIDSFGIFRGKKRAEFRAAAAELCCARTYPYAGYEEYRTVCDFLNLLFVIDETCDEQEGPEAAETCNIFFQAMSGELLDGPVFVHPTRQWKERLNKKHLPNSQRRFMKHFADYLDGVLRETELRDQRRTLGIEQYTLLRRKFSGTQTVFALFEYIHGIDLPDAVFDNQIFTKMYWAAIDMINFANDLYSYRMEAEKGLDGNNLLTILMQTEGFGLQKAVDRVGQHFCGLVTSFAQDKAKLPSLADVPGSYPGVDEDVAKYIHSMEQWVIGSLTWSFEGPRYFGADKDEVARTLIFPMRKSTFEDLERHD